MSQPVRYLKRVSEEKNRTSQFASGQVRFRQVFDHLDTREARFVRLVVRKSQHPVLQAATLFLNHLGNGWLYVVIVLFLLIAEGKQIWRPMLAISTSVALAHLLYHWIKSYLARVRPCDSDPTLQSKIKALDKYSCPSGHCMTATAVGLPLALTFPSAALSVLLMWLLIAWSRLSSGHHYPSDLVLGLIIGAGISLPVSAFLL